MTPTSLHRFIAPEGDPRLDLGIKFVSGHVGSRQQSAITPRYACAAALTMSCMAPVSPSTQTRIASTTANRRFEPMECGPFRDPRSGASLAPALSGEAGFGSRYCNRSHGLDALER